ncbi:hypothetical protein AMD01_17800 [Priestia koreensis]|uniref:TIGR00299 family protein n=1 Tax=Priestia koreensis TaxID=284581 RepID=A0A0M0KW02_9BACI|nr:hypothetical protein AMD01_17800 [Priestia koreensis]
MKTLYIDCFSGISGDMTIGALIDLGADPSVLKAELSKLKLDSEYDLSWKKVVKNGISSTKFDVHLKELHDHHSHDHEHRHEGHSHDHEHRHEGHSHDHEHSHEGHSHSHDHEHSHEGHSHSHDHEHSHEGHSHSHDHKHGHEGHSHSHDHRHYADIVQIIQEAGFNENVEKLALTIFEKIGRAEAKIHQIPFESVHFHEVGAIDSIVDIVGTCILMDQLQVSKVISSPVPVGSGQMRMAHGIYPVPAPAALEILKGIPLRATDQVGELTTPTGAAIVATLVDAYGTMPSFKVTDIGYGAGTKTFVHHPNVLRLILGEIEE